MVDNEKGIGTLDIADVTKLRERAGNSKIAFLDTKNKEDSELIYKLTKQKMRKGFLVVEVNPVEN
jgi:hypothetical protein